MLNLAVMVGLLSFFSGRNRNIHFKNWETESNLLVTGENEHYDVALLGTSRGRVFSRDSNHLTMENILEKKVINLSKGGGGGVMPAKVHLDHFYSRGNRVDHIIYFVDPWIFFCPINNENNTFFLRDEPFELSILGDLILNRFPSQRIISYLQMIAVDDWKRISQYGSPGLDQLTLKAIDPVKLEEARNHYLGLYDYRKFNNYSGFITRINKVAKQHKSKITYVLLPILMKDFPGAGQVDEKLKEISRKEGVGYFNLIDKMHDRHFFYDHMHFNSNGVAHFTETYMRSILKQIPYNRHGRSEVFALGHNEA
ncbi:hypothetical protein [Desulforapulum autotrophicum]|uniref:hypothetical protein n=1 Tax=Desulforapulum autotrophicum TaxID=2296 RepID=UPI001E3BF830|nr:hypothetical protein [Desulforapulum autotrophicum]